MGIKFHCPNGHKLNVKSFLAGKKGVCPHCGTGFRIPLQSEPKGNHKSAAADVGEDLVGDDIPAVAGAAQPEVMVAATNVAVSHPVAVVPQAATVPAPVTMPTPASAPVSIPMGQAVVAPVAPAPVPTPAPVVVDPIAEAPQAVWYVRPPTGSQYGPARGDIMKKWIGEGRVSAESLVWREGWTDWQPAAEVFAGLPSTSPNGQLSGPPNVPAPGFVAPTSSAVSAATSNSTSATRPAGRTGRRSSSPGLGIAIVVLLSIIAVGLLVALVMVIRSQGS